MADDLDASDSKWSKWMKSMEDHPIIVQLVGVVGTALIGKATRLDSEMIILAIAIIALILSAVLLARHRLPGKGKIFTVTLLVVATCSAWIGAVAADFRHGNPTATPTPTTTPKSNPPRPNLSPQPPSHRHTSHFGLKRGECVKVPGIHLENVPLPSSVETLSCTKKHDGEVFFADNAWSTQKPYPGERKIEEQAERRCEKEFQSYIGISYDKSVFEYSYWLPGAEMWSEADDRFLACIAHHPKQAVAYSVWKLGG